MFDLPSSPHIFNTITLAQATPANPGLVQRADDSGRSFCSLDRNKASLNLKRLYFAKVCYHIAQRPTTFSGLRCCTFHKLLDRRIWPVLYVNRAIHDKGERETPSRFGPMATGTRPFSDWTNRVIVRWSLRTRIARQGMPTKSLILVSTSTCVFASDPRLALTSLLPAPPYILLSLLFFNSC